MKPNKTFIPEKFLKEGFKKQVQHIENLIESSQLLYDSKKNSSSLSFAILALEEIAKLRLIREHVMENQGISKNGWYEMKKGGSHKMKLTKPSEQRKKLLEEMGEEKYKIIEEFKKNTGNPLVGLSYSEMKKATERYKMMAKFDKIKQGCFYLDWDGKKWTSVKISLSKRELEAITYFALSIVKWYLNQSILLSNHKKISTDPESASYKNYINDPLHKKDLEFRRSFKKPKNKS